MEPAPSQRPSEVSKKELLRHFRQQIDAQKLESRVLVKSKSCIKECFRIIIAILLSATTLTSAMQMSMDAYAFKIVMLSASIGSSVFTSIYGVLNLESLIAQNDKIVRSCESLALELDKLILTTKPIDDEEINSMILKMNQIINQTAVPTQTAAAASSTRLQSIAVK